MVSRPHFGPTDFVVFFGTIGLSLVVGIYFGWINRNKNSTDNYFLGNRKLSVIPTALSLAVTFQSSLMVIGFPAEVYFYGLKFAYTLVGTCASYIVAGLIIVPVLHPLKLTSVNRYFKLRYQDNVLRYLAMSLGILYYILYSGAVTFGTCVALDLLMGIPYWATIIMYSVVTAIYTSVGGMKAVVWTDVLQITIMTMGVLAINIKACIEVGGISNVLNMASSRLQLDDFRIDPTIRYQFWNLSFGCFMGYLVTSVQQPGVQRINSTATTTSARRIYVLSGVIYTLISLWVCFEGVSIFAYYSTKGCDPLASGRIDNMNQLVPLVVGDLFSNIPGLAGLFIATLSSATLSTLSSCLSGLGAMTYDDIIKENFPNMPDERATTISKVVVFLYGMVAMGFAALISALPGSIINITQALMGCADGPTCALFLVSLFFKRATTKGLVVGAVVGMVCILWLNVGAMLSTVASTPTLPPASTTCCVNETLQSTNTSNVCIINMNVSMNAHEAYDDVNEDLSVLETLYSISFMLYALIGCIISTLVAVPVSLCTSPPAEFDERCLFSFKTHFLKEFFKGRKGNDRTGVASPEVELQASLIDKSKSL